MNGARPLGFPQWPKQLGKRPTILISGFGQIQGKTPRPMDQGAGDAESAETEWNTISGQRDRNYAG